MGAGGPMSGTCPPCRTHHIAPCCRVPAPTASPCGRGLSLGAALRRRPASSPRAPAAACLLRCTPRRGGGPSPMMAWCASALCSQRVRHGACPTNAPPRRPAPLGPVEHGRLATDPTTHAPPRPPRHGRSRHGHCEGEHGPARAIRCGGATATGSDRLSSYSFRTRGSAARGGCGVCVWVGGGGGRWRGRSTRTRRPRRNRLGPWGSVPSP